MKRVLDLSSLEIRYERGVVFLDRCGSLMLRLQDTLGSAFRGSVPQMNSAHLKSDAEHITVTYSWASLIAQQRWAETPVRLEQVGPQAWDEVSKALDVSRQVVRCGLRFQFLWPMESLEEGQEVLGATGLMAPTDLWSQICGVPGYQSYAGVVKDHRGGKVRTSIDAVEHTVEGYVPSDLREKILPFAVQLDIDNVHANETPERRVYGLGGGQLREFMRESWSRSRRMADRVGELLERAK